MIKRLKPYDWSFGDEGACPTSDSQKKRHRGNKTARRSVIKTHPGWGKNPKPFTSTSYVDSVVCGFCGAKGDVEWMPAGF